MPIAKLNGTSLYYEINGTGTPVVFIHGHGLTHSMFKPQLEYFSDKYKVILCDLRGNGKSGELLQAPNEIIETQCLDIIMLLNDLGIREAVFVGSAYGGLVVQHIAKQYPERVKAIVVADSFCRSQASTIIGKIQLMAAYCSWLMYYAPSELVLPSIRMMYRERWNLAYNEIRRGLLDKRPRELYRQRLATSHVDYTRCLKSFKRPALCIVGDFSEFGVNCMKDMVSQLPHAQLVIIPNALDPSNLCQPEKFNAILQRFLEKQQETQQIS
ncbi:alpha/beta hydrolase [Paenibacillus sp. FSL E2-8871]|uniref:AB hydrolase-1 domain-containing protein n=1 Tax=Paenibacillus odorifer TaxID=189426 RepID=A0ABX3HCN5_9BACL|nr:alpha/beta hydrolase [Paenibacillus odorifer]OMD48245.1 hypothetical protein BSK51_22820 [Paenibacillus odorifer]